MRVRALGLDPPSMPHMIRTNGAGLGVISSVHAPCPAPAALPDAPAFDGPRGAVLQGARVGSVLPPRRGLHGPGRGLPFGRLDGRDHACAGAGRDCAVSQRADRTVRMGCGPTTCDAPAWGRTLLEIHSPAELIASRALASNPTSNLCPRRSPCARLHSRSCLDSPSRARPGRRNPIRFPRRQGRPGRAWRRRPEAADPAKGRRSGGAACRPDGRSRYATSTPSWRGHDGA